MEVVRIKKILARNLLIFIGLHCVRRSSWTVTTLATLVRSPCCSEFNNLYFLETSFTQDQRYFTFIYLTTFGQSKIAYFASYDPPEFLTLLNTYCRQSITKCWIGDSVKKSSRPSLNVNNLSLSLWVKVVSEAGIIYVSSGVPAHLVWMGMLTLYTSFSAQLGL